MRRYDTSCTCGPMSCVPTRKEGIPQLVIKVLYDHRVEYIMSEIGIGIALASVTESEEPWRRSVSEQRWRKAKSWSLDTQEWSVLYYYY